MGPEASPAKKKSVQAKGSSSKKTGGKSDVSSSASQSGWKQKRGVTEGVERSRQPLVKPVVVTLTEEESQKTGQHLRELQLFPVLEEAVAVAVAVAVLAAMSSASPLAATSTNGLFGMSWARRCRLF